MEDVFEPVYTPRKVEFWLDHWEELDVLMHSPKSSAHIAEHLAREWFLLEVRNKACLCKELHDVDSKASDPACSHTPSGGGSFQSKASTALCIVADLRQAADELPAVWTATRQIWQQQMLSRLEILKRVQKAAGMKHEREPVFARSVAIRRIAAKLGYSTKSIAA